MGSSYQLNLEKQKILEKQKMRFEVLKQIYLDTNGEEHKTTMADEISHITEVSANELIHVLQYLQREGLIKAMASIYDESSRVPIRILHPGIVEIESALLKPDEPTEHFPAQVFNITNNAPVTGQQFGNQNTLKVTQKSNLVEAAAEIQQLLQQLEQSYPTETFTQKAVVVDEALKQIEENPRFKSRVVGTLKSAGKEALQEAIDHPLVNIFMAAIDGW